MGQEARNVRECEWLSRMSRKNAHCCVPGALRDTIHWSHAQELSQVPSYGPGQMERAWEWPRLRNYGDFVGPQDIVERDHAQVLPHDPGRMTSTKEPLWCLRSSTGHSTTRPCTGTSLWSRTNGRTWECLRLRNHCGVLLAVQDAMQRGFIGTGFITVPGEQGLGMTLNKAPAFNWYAVTSHKNLVAKFPLLFWIFFPELSVRISFFKSRMSTKSEIVKKAKQKNIWILEVHLSHLQCSTVCLKLVRIVNFSKEHNKFCSIFLVVRGG